MLSQRSQWDDAHLAEAQTEVLTREAECSRLHGQLLVMDTQEQTLRKNLTQLRSLRAAEKKVLADRFYECEAMDAEASVLSAKNAALRHNVSVLVEQRTLERAELDELLVM